METYVKASRYKICLQNFLLKVANINKKKLTAPQLSEKPRYVWTRMLCHSYKVELDGSDIWGRWEFLCRILCVDPLAQVLSWVYLRFLLQSAPLLRYHLARWFRTPCWISQTSPKYIVTSYRLKKTIQCYCACGRCPWRNTCFCASCSCLHLINYISFSGGFFEHFPSLANWTTSGC